MALPLTVPVKESVKELKRLLRRSSAMNHPRLKMLIEMKKAGEGGISKRALKEKIGVSGQSIQTWRTAYKKGGIDKLLSNRLKGKAGRPSVFSRKEHKRLKEKLEDPDNGLQGYVEMQQWIREQFDKEVKYNTVLKYSARHFGSRVKVARRATSKRKKLTRKPLKKNFSNEVERLSSLAPEGCNRVNLFFQDESRFGLHTRNGRGLAAKGVQPICRFQRVFKYTYLSGAFSPLDGQRFLLEVPCCNSNAFQVFLDEFSKERPAEFKIIVLDNGAFHKAKKLRIPDNIDLLFLPPYSPELNPAEKIWDFSSANLQTVFLITLMK